MKKFLLLALLLSLPTLSNAMPSMSAKEGNKKSPEEKHAHMDTDKNKKVSVQEFKVAYPKMNDAVFGMIDLDKDTHISLEEWMKFQADHMQGMQKNEAQKGDAHKEFKEANKMLIIPPKDTN